MTITYYIIVTLILLICMLAYIPVARRLNIIDQPGSRSSHTKPTIRGGGIIFPVALFIWFAYHGFSYPMATAGLLLIATVSFADDVSGLSGTIRILFHLLAAAFLFQQMRIFGMHGHLVLAAFVITIGWINAFNFMDGINGITALYSMVCLAGFSLVNNAGLYMHIIVPPDQLVTWNPFLEPRFAGTLFFGVLVFFFFNARKHARVFAGDVGSVSMAFILAWMMIALMIHTREPGWILFFLVYGIDTVSTIIIRLYRRENIFEAHRLHLYQLLANQRKWPHLKVAIIYASLQMVINLATIVLFFSGMLTWSMVFTLTVFFWIIYIIVRMKLLTAKGVE